MQRWGGLFLMAFLLLSEQAFAQNAASGPRFRIDSSAARDASGIAGGVTYTATNLTDEEICLTPIVMGAYNASGGPRRRVVRLAPRQENVRIARFRRRHAGYPWSASATAFETPCPD